MSELLSICIPTYNRSNYLHDLLEGLVSELQKSPTAASEVRVYISDNASTDSTEKAVSSFFDRWPILYHQNRVNIGGDRNFARMIGRAKGTYFWLLGDDECLVPGCLEPLLNLLRTQAYHLILLQAIKEDGKSYDYEVPLQPTYFPTYRDFADFFRKAYPWKLMVHSFISMMVIKSTIYDKKMARRVLKTVDRNYSHMYGVVEGLSRHPGGIYLQSLPTICIRDNRALVDTSVLQLIYLWSRYYRWLGIKFGYPDLIAYGRRLFGWRKRCRWVYEQIAVSLGLGPKITR
jgi:glycosyltransferase involved in cell wall biosynthesis